MSYTGEKEWEDKTLVWSIKSDPEAGNPVYQVLSHYLRKTFVPLFPLLYCQCLLTILSASHRQTTQTLHHQNPFVDETPSDELRRSAKAVVADLRLKEGCMSKPHMLLQTTNQL